MDSPVQHKTPRWAAERMLRSATAMPSEIVNYILDKVYPPATSTAMLYKAFPKKRTVDRTPYFTPPAGGTSPFMKLPTELRKAIFLESLPSKDDLIHPICDDDKDGASSNGPERLRSNRTADLMTLNKTIRDEIALIVYEERTLVIHVHEGLKHGGIEFLHAGRQPLHYQESVSDGRFWKFSQNDSDKRFGFRRLKKIRIQIFPSSHNDSCKHSAINTYFTTLALVRLLERNCEDDKDRITNLTIEFMKGKATGTEQGRAAILRAEHYWWDPDKNKPRETSIHGLPNIELILRPFANLRCHTVNIEMPDHIHDYARIAVFVRDFKVSMTSQASMMTLHGSAFADDDLERKIESARWAMEDYVYSTKYGFKHRKVGNLNESEAQDAAPDRMDLDSDAEDDRAQLSQKKRELSPGKRALSPGSKASSPGSDSKRSKTEEKVAAWQRVADESGDESDRSSLDEDEEMARAIEESQRFAGRPTDKYEEDKQFQQAIEASLADLTRRDIPDRTARFSAYGYGKALSASTSNGSAFVGQGRTLGGIPGTLNSGPISARDRYVHNSAAPWNAASPSLKSFYRSRLIDGSSNTATATSNESSQPSPSAGMPPPLPSTPQDAGVPQVPRDADMSLPDAPPTDNATNHINQAEEVNVEVDTDGEDESPFRRRRFPRSCGGDGDDTYPDTS